MQKKNIKTLVYALVAVFCLVGGIYYSILKNTNTSFLKTSVLTILKAVNQDLETDVPPDLAITDVSFEKIYDPTPSFNYYKYKVDLVVKNYGGTLVNANVVVSGDHNQKASFVKNTTKGFYLQKDGTYVISGYEMLFDGDYNGGKITLAVDVKDKTDSNLLNNSASVDILELPPKIRDISLSGISDEKSFLITFENNPDVKNYDFDIFTTRQYSFPEDSLKYAEAYGLGRVYGYYRTQNNSDIITSSNWQKIDFDKENLSVKFTEDLFTDIDEHYLYLKATNKENGFYVFSNVVKFPRYTELTYEEFVKDFTEYTGVDVAGTSVLYGNYLPKKTVTRGDVLRAVLDSYGMKLSKIIGEQYFEDIPLENVLYPYSVSLHDNSLWKTFGHKLNPGLPATVDYLKYLVYAYRENS
ncbi:MAG: hypothetical protein WCX95_05430 [Candidatus Gracilibacteria bacterium]